MQTLLDCRYQALLDQGFTGHVNDMMLEWLQLNGATSGNLNDAWSEMLIFQGFSGVKTDGWYALLGSLGWQGHINDREFDFWCLGRGLIISIGLTVGNAGTLYGYRKGGASPDFGEIIPNSWGNDPTTEISLFFGNTSNDNNIICALDESQWDGAEQISVTLTGSPLGTYVYDWNEVSQRYIIDDSDLALFFQAELGNIIPFEVVPVGMTPNFITENGVPLVEKGVYLTP